jgi:YD repeat-containing protein
VTFTAASVKWRTTFFPSSNYTTLLLAMTEGTEIIPEHVPAIHRLLHSINEHGQALRRYWDEAHQASERLAKP